LDQDEHGYPPAETEILWAKPSDGCRFLIDNIPFFVMGISTGDEVVVKELENKLYFLTLATASGNSTFRLVLSDPTTSEKVRTRLALLGCPSEYNERLALVAVEVPTEVNIDPFLKYVIEAQQKGELDIEEGALRHKV
jgi:hypothetical protein